MNCQGRGERPARRVPLPAVHTRLGRRQPRVGVGDLRPGRTGHLQRDGSSFVRGLTEALDIEVEWLRDPGDRHVAAVRADGDDRQHQDRHHRVRSAFRSTAQDVADAIVPAAEPSWPAAAPSTRCTSPSVRRPKCHGGGLAVLTGLADAAGQQEIGAVLMFKMTVEDAFVIRNPRRSSRPAGWRAAPCAVGDTG